MTSRMDTATHQNSAKRQVNHNLLTGILKMKNITATDYAFIIVTLILAIMLQAIYKQENDPTFIIFFAGLFSLIINAWYTVAKGYFK